MDLELVLPGGERSPAIIDLKRWHKPGAPLKDHWFFCLVCDVAIKDDAEAEKHSVNRAHRAILNQQMTQEELRKCMQLRANLIREVSTVAKKPNTPANGGSSHGSTHVAGTKRMRSSSQVCDVPDPRYFSREPSVIQSDLDARGDVSFIGLEYVVEVKPDRRSLEDSFAYCALCSASFHRMVLGAHLVSFNHRSKYIHDFLPGLWGYHMRNKVILDRENLAIVSNAIQEHIGRSPIWVVTKQTFVDSKSAIHEALQRRSHLMEHDALAEALRPVLRPVSAPPTYYQGYNFYDANLNDAPTVTVRPYVQGVRRGIPGNQPVPSVQNQQTMSEEEERRKREFDRRNLFNADLARKLAEWNQKWASYDQETFEDHPQYNAEWEKYYLEHYGEMDPESEECDMSAITREWGKHWIRSRMPELKQAEEMQIRQDVLKQYGYETTPNSPQPMAGAEGVPPSDPRVVVHGRRHYE